MKLTERDRQLLNQVQRDFPLDPEPFKVLSEQLEMPEEEILQRLERLQQAKAISRFGAVFDHHRAGASTLAAIAVPEQEVDRVAEFINGFDEVNHNYQREHEFNIWFVVNAADRTGVDQVLNNIASEYDYPVLDLPMVKGYHIDLGFPLW